MKRSRFSSLLFLFSHFSSCAEFVCSIFKKAYKCFLWLFSVFALFVDFCLDAVDEFFEHFKNSGFCILTIFLLGRKEILNFFDFVCSFLESNRITAFSFNSFSLNYFIKFRQIRFKSSVEWVENLRTNFGFCWDISAKEVNFFFQDSNLLSFRFTATYNLAL